MERRGEIRSQDRCREERLGREAISQEEQVFGVCGIEEEDAESKKSFVPCGS